MKNILNNLIKSFNGQDEGFSSRKLTAFIIILCIVATHIKWLTLGNLSQLEMVLTIDYGFIATLFGMTTYSALKTNKEIKENSESLKEEKPENKIEEN